MKLKRYLLLSVVALLMITGCQHEVTSNVPATYQVTISFDHVVGSQALQLNSTYLDPFLEPFTITNFKYYISNLSFTDSTGAETSLPGSYFLVDEKIPASKSLTVSVASPRYSKLSFYVGVDSARNVSGVQTGALDPANGMFWTWSTGYIMAKLEGTSPLSPAPLQGVTYHIGGFKAGENVVKKVTLDLPVQLNISTAKPSQVRISADVNAWFKGVSDIKIADNAYCMNPGALASAIAENYLKMFLVKEVIN